MNQTLPARGIGHIPVSRTDFAARMEGSVRTVPILPDPASDISRHSFLFWRRSTGACLSHTSFSPNSCRATSPASTGSSKKGRGRPQLLDRPSGNSVNSIASRDSRTRTSRGSLWLSMTRSRQIRQAFRGPRSSSRPDEPAQPKTAVRRTLIRLLRGTGCANP
jgi:hypothetical protein